MSRYAKISLARGYHAIMLLTARLSGYSVFIAWLYSFLMGLSYYGSENRKYMVGRDLAGGNS